MAAPIQEARDRKIKATAALNAALDKKDSARAAVSAVLERQMVQGLTPEQRTALASELVMAESAQVELEAQISAARKLEALAEESLLAEQSRLEREKANAVASNGAGLGITRTESVEDQRDKLAKDPKRGFEKLSDFLGSVMKAGHVAAGRAGKVDERLTLLAAAGSDEQGTYSDPFGGFLVPAALAPGILSIGAEGDPLASYVTNIPMTAPSVSFNARVDKNHTSSVSGGLTVSRRPETVDGSSSRMQFEQVKLQANEEFGLAYASESILADSPVSFIALLSAGINDEYVSFAMGERLRGSGTGERMGVLSNPAGATSPLISIAKETGQAALSITKENIDKMAARTHGYGKAVYLANPTTRPKLKSLVQIVGTSGHAVAYLTGQPGGAEYLDNRPIFWTEHCSAVGTVGDIICGDWSQYLEGMYQSAQYAESVHVRFVSNERAFKFFRRTDGRPWWTSPFTPKNGDTQSPFTVIATRA